ncbi:MAG TPA: VanW family protein [bacterium]|jgi:vancomycin resistance protein YoaR|nr:VanW family protein [bacterium]
MRALGLLLGLLAIGMGPACAAPAEELSRFTCERPRPWEAGALRNVSVAASLVDKIVLEPGAVFSFNQTMLAGDGRFAAGTSFLGGREVKSVGGGICQVSSGLYNAALLAGLDVVERSSHSLYDPREAYVVPGRDAMVSRGGHSDFRFRNSTAADLTIEARARGGRLTVALMGTQHRPRRRWVEATVLHRYPSRVVEVPDPSLPWGACRQMNRGFDGISASSRLCWVESDGITRCAELGVDHYERVDEVWRVGAPEGKP